MAEVVQEGEEGLQRGVAAAAVVKAAPDVKRNETVGLGTSRGRDYSSGSSSYRSLV